jgi:hypothetical protein
MASPDRDTVPERYAKALAECSSADDVRRVVAEFGSLACGACAAADAMTDADFVVFKRGLKKERRGVFAGEAFAERYAALVMPEPMFTVSLVADHYKVPFNVARVRLQMERPELFEAAS